MRHFWVTCFLASMISISAAAQPAPVSDADMRSARAVVQAQLDAFAADDGPRAFSFATQGLREMFGSADRFMAMVRAGYPVVYRPASVAFLVPEWLDSELIQGVHFTDEQGGLWLALYRLQRQRDNSWRINGCELVESHARTT
jgi:Domain of unknown function (DUF4864)